MSLLSAVRHPDSCSLLSKNRPGFNSVWKFTGFSLKKHHEEELLTQHSTHEHTAAPTTLTWGITFKVHPTLPSLVSGEGHVCPSVEVFYWGLHTITVTSASCQRLVWWKVLLLHLSSLSGTFLWSQWSQWSQWLTWHDCYASHHSLLCLMTQTDYKSPIVCLSHGPVRVCIYLCELNFSWKCFCLYYKSSSRACWEIYYCYFLSFFQKPTNLLK